MPIAALQPRLSQMGVIRLGQQLMSRNNKPYPSKLETFRITSPLRSVVDQAAALFGGEARPWKNTTGPEWEVITRARELNVFVPPQRIDPNYERWGNGYRDRLCDGVTERLRGGPCLCTAEYGGEFFRTAPVGKVCKTTTRLSLMIAELSGLGVFKLESHGWNAASELPMLADQIAKTAFPVPARLVLQNRDGKFFDPHAPEGEQVKPKSYIVPVLLFEFLTPQQAYSGQLEEAAQTALAARAGQHAIGAGPAVEPWTAQRVIAAAADITSTPELQALWKTAGNAGVLTDEVKQALEARAAEIAPKAAGLEQPETAATRPRMPRPAREEEPVDAEIVETPAAPVMSGAQAWQAALQEAADRGWNRKDLADRFEAEFGCDYRDDKVTDEMLVEFYQAVADGLVS